MNDAADRFEQGEHAYQLAISMLGTIGVDILTGSAFGGPAYRMWAELSDLLDAPGGPQSEEMCVAAVRRSAQTWKAVDKESRRAVARYFAEMLDSLS